MYPATDSSLPALMQAQGEARADVVTLATASRLDNVRAVYGPGVARELMPLKLKV